jgi:hypothetical protein
MSQQFFGWGGGGKPVSKFTQYLLYPLNILPIEFSWLIPLKMQYPEPDTRGTSVLDKPLCLDP